jgi:hypothetical protein
MIPLWIANCFLMKYSTRTQRQVRTYGSRPPDKSRDPKGPPNGPKGATRRLPGARWGRRRKDRYPDCRVMRLPANV